VHHLLPDEHRFRFSGGEVARLATFLAASSRPFPCRRGIWWSIARSSSATTALSW